ncbi:MAG: DUF3592 domain-containing protein [Clostridia bacterium]|nr:DUF3592 domain-containing protein [Clostridia bacterium]MDD4387326.1 DUF3592 domain-containing protein [Clostridia bacterium]
MNDNKPPFMILIPFMLIGILLLIIGANNIYTTNLKTKDYVAVDGKFIKSSIYSNNSDETTYKLTYSYVVNNQEYYISTDYGTSSVPKVGSTKTIKYDMNNPEQAILSGFGTNEFLLYGGILFLGIPLIVIFKSAALVGIIFTLMGFGAYYMMCSSTNSLSPIEAFKINGLWILIPIIFIVVGIWTLIGRLFMKKEKFIIIKIEKIENIGTEGKSNILFIDEKISDNSFVAITSKYFVYESNSENKFVEGKKYKINLYKYGIMFGCQPITDIIQARVLSSFNDEDFVEEL